MSKPEDESSVLPLIATDPLERRAPRRAPRPKRLAVSRAVSTVHASITTKFSRRLKNFMDLPFDIRLLIWEAALPDGRVHELYPCKKRLPNGEMALRSNHSTPPVLLSVCRESRDIALQHYRLLTYNTPPGISRHIRRFYFSPARDTLFMNALIGLYVAYMLMDATKTPVIHAMYGWKHVALDAGRAGLLTTIAGQDGNLSVPRLEEMFPDMRTLTMALHDAKYLTKMRQSRWPAENGTTLRVTPSDILEFDPLLRPFEGYMRSNYPGAPVRIYLAQTSRKRFLRRDVRDTVIGALRITVRSLPLGLRRAIVRLLTGLNV